jgi:hypothetical protein
MQNWKLSNSDLLGQPMQKNETTNRGADTYSLNAMNDLIDWPRESILNQPVHKLYTWEKF